jgi:predicted aconitase with swiveling domain
MTATQLPDTLRGRGLAPGTVTAEAVVTGQPISGWGGVDPKTGTIIESRHELHGVCIAGKVLVFPGAKGSSGLSGMFHIARILGTTPAALVFNQMNTKIALGVVISRVPAVTGLDRDPLTTIGTGDLVRVDGSAGTVEILRRAAG